jgi:hypothetical protein
MTNIDQSVEITPTRATALFVEMQTEKPPESPLQRGT